MHTPRIVDHCMIDNQVAAPAPTCKNLLRANLTARVDIWEAYAHMTPQTRRLLQMSDTWSDAEPSQGRMHRPQYQPRQTLPLEERLNEADVTRIVKRFLSRTATQQELAVEYGTSVSSIKRLLRERDVRLWTLRHHKS